MAASLSATPWLALLVTLLSAHLPKDGFLFGSLKGLQVNCFFWTGRGRGLLTG